MMTKRFRRAILLLLGAGALLLSGATSAWAGGSQLFKASFSGTVQFTGQNTISFVGAGRATLMGRFTDDGQVLITGESNACPGGVANVHTETLTDNDGDTLTISSDDVSCPIAPGLYHGTGEWHAIGGTGRLANANGGGSLDGYADFNAGTFSISLNGVLSVPRG